MKPIISLIDFIMIKEGKKTLKFIKDESLKSNANEETLLKILKDNKDTKYQLFKEIRTSIEVFSYFLLMMSI